ncbi:hypothetical protein BC835DRAFT_1363729 [Cytidiella melzeri]|nr:hypothetical protein BC835DRAFT_1363729 [Cytidiella melzeri]
MPSSKQSSAADPDAMHPHPHPLHDYHCFQHIQPHFAAHLQHTPHIPLPIDTPLPPSSFEFPANGAYPGTAGHPLFEGVMAMHQMLGHDLTVDWTDMSACNQSTAITYPYQTSSDYTHEPISQWPSPPPSAGECTPSPLDESPPHIPEYAPDRHVIISTQNATRQLPQSAAPPAGACSTFPLVVTSSNTYEHTVAFQADRQSSEKARAKLDPHAAGFLREKLGEPRWTIFSSRLAERRTTTQRPRPKPDAVHIKVQSGPSVESFPADKAGGATVIDFLVKVEVVKSVLRTYVPHPYNPLKSLSHPYDPAPSGQVTLTRSTVLSLSGWSNTQFSYWARRAEATSVLAMHDDRLRTAATALERRLYKLGLTGSSDPHSSPATSHDATPLPDSSSETDAEEWARMYVTGKGLDVIIDEVKKRTGVSPFLRGKHSSLDPFGSARIGVDGVTGGNKVAVYMPTFQAEKYVHEMPESTDTKLSDADGKRSGKRKATSPAPTATPPPMSSMTSESGDSIASWQDAWVTEDALQQFTMPVHSQTQESPSPTYSADDSNSGFATHCSEAVSYSTLSAALHDDRTAQLVDVSDPSPRPKKRRLAPAPPASSSSSSFSAEVMRMYHHQQHL